MRNFDHKTRLSIVLLGLVMLLGNGTALAGISTAQYPSPEEILELPEYCQVQRHMIKYLYRGTTKKPGADISVKAKRWEATLGTGNYNHLHHYCWGLAQLNRCFKAVDPYPEYDMHRRSNLNQAIANFEYVRLRVSDDFPLLPELLLNEAIAFRELGKFQNAIDLLMGSISRRKDYARAYVELARILEAQGRVDEAGEVLVQGVRETNNDPAIAKAMESLTNSR